MPPTIDAGTRAIIEQTATETAYRAAKETAAQFIELHVAQKHNPPVADRIETAVRHHDRTCVGALWGNRLNRASTWVIIAVGGGVVTVLSAVVVAWIKERLSL